MSLLTSNSITDEATSTIAATLKKPLKPDVGDNPITSQSGHFIIKALQLNTTLCCLDNQRW